MSQGRPPKVSIGLPVYNAEAYLRAALDSLLAQTVGDFEVVICDNASTDATPDICREYAARDPRVTYHRNDRNRGVGYNHRRVFELSRGEFFRWAGADDVVEPRLLERCLDVLERDPKVVLAYPRTLVIDTAGLVVEQYEDRMHLTAPDPATRVRALFRDLRKCNAVYGLMRSATLRRTGLQGDFAGSDVCLLVELCLHGPFAEIPEFLFSRRVHGGSVSAAQNHWHHKGRTYRPSGRPGPSFRGWRHQLEYHRAVQRAPRTVAERARLHAYFLRRIIVQRRLLAREALAAVAHFCTRRAQAPAGADVSEHASGIGRT